jgi:hypothetical protein
VKLRYVCATALALSTLLVQTTHATPPPAGPFIIAIGSIDGLYEDFATNTAAPLENNLPGNRLGGLGSGLTWIGGDYFLGLPDRGPNATDYNDCLASDGKDALDNTTSFINRFHTLHLSLAPSDPGSKLPFTLTPMLVKTTLLSSRTPLFYGPGCGDAHSGVPALNAIDRTYYFSGRSDNFNPHFNPGNPRDSSGNPNYARLDPESIRVSNDRRSVYISDEYGPYVYAFDRRTGERTRSFTLPSKFFVANLSPHVDFEIANNTVGRVTNKGMEGLAITPDGRTLVGAMQSPLIQDGGDVKGGVTRIITIDIHTGKTHEYAYQLDKGTKTTISDILAVNDHEFLVDERDSKGRADAPGSKSGFKKLYSIDLRYAHDVSDVSGITGGVPNIAQYAVQKDLFLDIVAVLTSDPVDMAATAIPAKLEGISFGPDVVVSGVVKHTIWVANDNDFLTPLPPLVGSGDNPNQFFVFAFDDHDLPFYEPQQFHRPDDDDHGHDDDHDHDRR